MSEEHKTNIIKPILWLTGGTLATWGLVKLFSYKKAYDQLVVRVSKVKKIDIVGGILGHLRFKVDILLINPAKQTFTLEINHIRVLFDETEIGYSLPVKKIITIDSQSQATYSDLEFNIPVTDIPIKNIAQAIANLNFKSITDRISLDIYTEINGSTFNYIYSLKDAENLGVVAQFKRNIKDGNNYNYLFPAIPLQDIQISKNGSVEETVKYMAYIVKQCHNDTKALAESPLFKAKTLEETANKIFNFCYDHIQYRLDKAGVEQLRRPARTWSDRHEGVDCDDYTTFIASILYNLKIPFKFRITKYGGKSYFQHIYIIVPKS